MDVWDLYCNSEMGTSLDSGTIVTRQEFFGGDLIILLCILFVQSYLVIKLYEPILDLQ